MSEPTYVGVCPSCLKWEALAEERGREVERLKAEQADLRKANLGLGSGLAEQNSELVRLRARCAEWEREEIHRASCCVDNEAEVGRLRGDLDRADCTRREGGDARHCSQARLCWRCRAERFEALSLRLKAEQADLRKANLGLGKGLAEQGLKLRQAEAEVERLREALPFDMPEDFLMHAQEMKLTVEQLVIVLGKARDFIRDKSIHPAGACSDHSDCEGCRIVREADAALAAAQPEKESR